MRRPGAIVLEAGIYEADRRKHRYDRDNDTTSQDGVERSTPGGQVQDGRFRRVGYAGRLLRVDRRAHGGADWGRGLRCVAYGRYSTARAGVSGCGAAALHERCFEAGGGAGALFSDAVSEWDFR